MPDKHAPILTLEEFDAIDRAESMDGYMEYRLGDPEPGMNRSRSYHHGWRCARFDREKEKAEGYEDHMRLVRAVVDRERVARGEKPRGPWGGADA
jgi:hypothetical protein